ncbi:MAG: alpha-amylase family glycosyl hydrolase [Ignavibacteriales bacterium]
MKQYNDLVFYHVYPLGFCGAPDRNDFSAPAVNRLDKLHGWIGHMKNLGVNALYLGPVFESSAHGYDTADYYWVDRRLGTNESLRNLAEALHSNGIKVILDGVFNHVGRNFWAFRDVQQNRQASAYCGWFHGLDFSRTSPCGDPFSYEGWNGHYDLVKLNLKNPQVKSHLLEAVRMWIEDLGIDGLRLDAADCVDMDFMRELSAFTKGIRSDFFLLGEVIHGDYRQWANPQMLDSVTNYECYKGLYSSLNDKNYFEIAYALNRQYGEHGMYKNIPLYSFTDNHDVNRVASQLKNKNHLYPLYCLLFTMPGMPSIYYGSEWGVEGVRTNNSDKPLRPCLELQAYESNGHSDLYRAISRLSKLRNALPALKYGSYRTLFTGPEQFAFLRETQEESILVILNSSQHAAELTLEIKGMKYNSYTDLLNEGQYNAENGRLRFDNLYPNWALVLKGKR